MSNCSAVSDLAPLAALANLQSLIMRYCSAASDLAPLKAMTSLKSSASSSRRYTAYGGILAVRIN
jgi:hypothetical protein